MTNTLHRRALLGAGLGLAAGAVAATAFAGAAQADDHALLRVATFNIHHGASPDNVLDLERIARIIEGLDLDVVGLQEVDRHWGARSEWLDEPAWFGERLGMRHAYGANLDLDPLREGDPRRQYGTAILSRRPILDSSNTLLPKFPKGEQRGLLRATIEAHGARITFAVTHLQHNDTAERQAQSDAIVAMLARDRTVLTGDLNAEADKAEIRTLTDVYEDTWPKAGDGPGYTYDVLNPHARIDFVLATPDVRPVSARVVTEAATASDHLPVVVEIKVRKGVH